MVEARDSTSFFTAWSAEFKAAFSMMFSWRVSGSRCERRAGASGGTGATTNRSLTVAARSVPADAVSFTSRDRKGL
jgi:hypothetical protein